MWERYLKPALLGVALATILAGVYWFARGDPWMGLAPSDAPGAGETVITARDPVATRCAETSGRIAAGADGRLMRSVVTTSRRWGTVWRADVLLPTAPGAPGFLYRVVCRKRFVAIRPLQMFDAKYDIPPLPEEGSRLASHRDAGRP